MHIFLVYDNNNINYHATRYLYKTTKTKNKTTLWECFGDILVENLKINVPLSYVYCEKCGGLTKKLNNKTKYCKICAKEIERINHRERNKKWYKNKNSDEIENTSNTHE